MINSIESDRLSKLIDRKLKLYREKQDADPDDPALKYLNSEITFLRDQILPIVLCETTVNYSELRDYMTRTMRKVEERPTLARTATDLLIHFHLKDPKEGKQPIVAYASNMGHQRQFCTEMFIDDKEALTYPL